MSDAAVHTGGCLCGAVRFEVRAPFDTAGYCHCTRCQRRTGVGFSVNGLVAARHVVVVAGADAIGTWHPSGGHPKSFCSACGAHLFSGAPGGDGVCGVRFGALDEAPGVEPEWHMWTSSAPAWSPVPDDGLARHPGGRPD